MKPMPPFSTGTLIMLLVVLFCAAGVRVWYIATCADNGQSGPAIMVQGPTTSCHFLEEKAFRGRTAPTQLDNLVANIVEERSFKCLPPLADSEELTGHGAPLYPLLFGAIASWNTDWADTILRWLQSALGTLTAVCYFFFARRAFHNTLIALLAGLLVAFYPYYVLNTAELNDGVLATFLVSLSLALGARAGQVGGAFTGLTLGVCLAGVALTRAALMPFAAIAVLAFLSDCRRFPLGWFAGFLALMGFGNGLALWGIRDYLHFERPVPIATSTYLHLWIGNNPRATGSTLDESTLRASLPPERLKDLLSEPNQAKRYNALAPDVWQEIRNHPADTMARRLQASLAFVLGDRWLKQHEFALIQDMSDAVAEPPSWLRAHADTILQATLLGLLVLSIVGWRWSYAWRRYGRIGAIATLLIPISYILSHAESLSGPRLPLDGVLLCYAAFALASLLPGLVGAPKSAARGAEEKVPTRSVNEV